MKTYKLKKNGDGRLEWRWNGRPENSSFLATLPKMTINGFNQFWFWIDFSRVDCGCFGSKSSH